MAITSSHNISVGKAIVILMTIMCLVFSIATAIPNAKPLGRRPLQSYESPSGGGGGYPGDGDYGGGNYGGGGRGYPGGGGRYGEGGRGYPGGGHYGRGRYRGGGRGYYPPAGR
ncbi:hypothetical protein ACFE04_012536 [Oxalis oulophora]